MKQKIGCLHAHYSNIAYIEKALTAYEVELIHFVDPGLITRMASDETYSLSEAERRVKEQVEWIAQCNVDAIIITCTNYIAILQEDQLSVQVPIIKLDEPFFNYICDLDQPHILLFTNPATVEGTMKRLHEYAGALGKEPQVEVQVINHAFELIMQGKKEQYHIVTSKYIRNLLESEKGKLISVAQLSMVEAVKEVQKETKVKLGNPLETLVSYLEENLFRRSDKEQQPPDDML
ncbi:hypothetical protein [Cohnella luojiensis]|uniref:Asp/Glu racemase n=1 Tax=Cohnella luojiensis TaxID=652876 RepID=A0A4Y8LQX0_9BACL|nr:hypothetical protein [Cohnella luojiensis]TFE19586.1 hypothetical protein E2980_22730 [Cohnella luojiensis]